jgi:Cytochrome c554 and c-prime
MSVRSSIPLGALALLLGLMVLPFLTPNSPRRASPPTPESTRRAHITGQVCTRHGPLEGATVRIKGTTDTTTTDSKGRFHLPRPEQPRRVTAWKDGHFIAGTPLTEPLLLTLRPLPKKDNEDYEWIDPRPDPKGKHNCANCHAEIYREWSGSGHARAATGRHFQDLYAGTGAGGRTGVGWSLLGQHPLGAGVCGSCHAPTIPVGDPARFDITKVSRLDALGVHCDYCHKVRGEAEGKFGLSHGRYKLDLLRPDVQREAPAAGGQLFFGPLDDVDRGDDSFSPFYRDSRYCAACHEGIVFGVHVYSTYSEWRDSPARRQGLQCQDCHMRPTGHLTNIAPGKGGIERDPGTLGNHRFFAGSREEMLKNCVRLSVRLEHTPGGTQAAVALRTEGVGHRVPTGFIDRHLILTVEGFDRTNRPVRLMRGPTLPGPAGQALAGRAGKLYGRLLHDFDGHGPAPFWRANPEVADTRLSPGQADHLRFEFPPELHRLRVRVIYRRFWQAVAREKGWAERDLVIAEQSLP